MVQMFQPDTVCQAPLQVNLGTSETRAAEGLGGELTELEGVSQFRHEAARPELFLDAASQFSGGLWFAVGDKNGRRWFFRRAEPAKKLVSVGVSRQSLKRLETCPNRDIHPMHPEGLGSF